MSLQYAESRFQQGSEGALNSVWQSCCQRLPLLTMLSSAVSCVSKPPGPQEQDSWVFEPCVLKVVSGEPSCDAHSAWGTLLVL